MSINSIIDSNGNASLFKTIVCLLTLYQTLLRRKNRSYGVWRPIVLAARIYKQAQHFAVTGPDERIFYLDLSDVGHLVYLAKGEVATFEILERQLGVCRDKV